MNACQRRKGEGLVQRWIFWLKLIVVYPSDEQDDLKRYITPDDKQETETGELLGDIQPCDGACCSHLDLNTAFLSNMFPNSPRHTLVI